MAPQVGLEPTTDRLTADSSTTELLWNNKIKYLPGNVLLSRNVSPTTIGAKELNFCVRHGNRCDLFAIVTKQFLLRDKRSHTFSLRKMNVYTFKTR